MRKRKREREGERERKRERERLTRRERRKIGELSKPQQQESGRPTSAGRSTATIQMNLQTSSETPRGSWVITIMVH